MLVLVLWHGGRKFLVCLCHVVEIGVPFEAGMVRLADMADDVTRCSFIDFWSKYRFESDGRPRKAAKKHKTKKRLVHVTEPMVVVPKPSVPLAWSKPGHPCRAWYCECMLKRHKPFVSKEGYEQYLDRHGGNYEAAFESFATSDSAPASVQDAFARWA